MENFQSTCFEMFNSFGSFQAICMHYSSFATVIVRISSVSEILAQKNRHPGVNLIYSFYGKFVSLRNEQKEKTHEPISKMVLYWNGTSNLKSWYNVRSAQHLFGTIFLPAFHRTQGFDNIDRLLFQYYILRSYSKWASTHKQQSIDLVPHWIRAWCWTQYEWKIHREKNKWKDGQRVKEEQESGQKALGEREREREFTKITTDFNKNYRSRKFALAISTTFISFSGNWFLTTPFAFNYTKDPREEWW